jgi:hypothetical protein
MSGSSKNNPQAKRTEEDSENGGVGLRDGLNGSTNCPPCAGQSGIKTMAVCFDLQSINQSINQSKTIILNL